VARAGNVESVDFARSWRVPLNKTKQAKTNPQNQKMVNAVAESVKTEG